MKLMERLHSIASRLGIIRVVSKPAADPGAGASVPAAEDVVVVMRTVRLAEITAEIRSLQVETLAGQATEMSVPFEKVFAAAGVVPAGHGWDMPRLQALLMTPQYQTMNRESIQKAILGMMETQGVTVEDLIKDAVARDRALDAWEQYVRRKLDERRTSMEGRVEQLERQIHDLQKEIEQSRTKMKLDEAQWEQWLDSKRDAEDQLAWSIGFLLDEPIITRDDRQDS